MTDKYDEAMERLKAAPNFLAAVGDAWFCPLEDVNGCLFRYVQPPKYDDPNNARPAGHSGCLCQIRGEFGNALRHDGTDDPALTSKIRADEKIPLSFRDITPSNLVVFADWQRFFDLYYGRE